MKIAFHTLGCKVNQYETEAMKEQFSAKGHQIVSEEDFADVYLINTCTVTNLADRKSRQYIRKMKKINPDSIVAVTGCYAQMSPEEVSKIEGVNIVAGTNEKNNLLGYIENYAKTHKVAECHIKPYEQLDVYESTGIITSMESRTRAYIKIQEGCNRFCSYCIIPFARGKVRSRPMEEILAEVEGILKKGFKEIILTGINTALYGVDLGFDGIEPLIKGINSIDGDFRIRLSSLEPTVINAEYVKKLLNYPKLCPHLHLSIQSGSDHVLQLMNRKYTRDEYIGITKVLKDFDPLYGITTDIIVGFPGETEQDFEDSMKIVDEVGFCKVHTFKYSKRKGTIAAEMNDQIDSHIKALRSSMLISYTENSRKRFFSANEGAIRRVLLEEMVTPTMLSGYSDNYIKIYIDGNSNMLNQFYDVKLIKEYKDGMKGEI